MANGFQLKFTQWPCQHWLNKDLMGLNFFWLGIFFCLFKDLKCEPVWKLHSYELYFVFYCPRHALCVMCTQYYSLFLLQVTLESNVDFLSQFAGMKRHNFTMHWMFRIFHVITPNFLQYKHSTIPMFCSKLFSLPKYLQN